MCGVGKSCHRRLSLAALWSIVAFGLSLMAPTSLRAETLVVPFQCVVDADGPRLVPGPETAFPVLGLRLEQPFSVCRGKGASSCTLMMVHRFDVSCAGVRLSWAELLQRSRLAGRAIPNNLPSGFAPVSTVAGRFVLPSLALHTPGRADAMSVDREELPPDVIVRPSQPQTEVHEVTGWNTVVTSEAAPSFELGALAGSGWTTTILLALATGVSALTFLMHPGTAARLLAWWPGNDAPSRSGQGPTTGFAAGVARVLSGCRAAWESFSRSADYVAHDGADDYFPMVESRLSDVEMTIAALPSDLLLRDVLMSELAQLRARTQELSRRRRRQSPDRSAAACRAILRDLDRIQRIALTSAEAVDETPYERATTAETATPRTVADAYKVLGLNADAPPPAAKKLVDALRMSWHPDLASDDSERAYREERMKQINVAWDMVKAEMGQRAAA